jgi:hypothetical protein
MKRRFTIVAATLALLAIFIAPMGMMGQTRAEEVYKTSQFGSGYNSQGVSSYTGNNWYSTTNGFRLDIVNANNNNNQWNYIKIGGKNGAYTGKLTTNAVIDEPVTKVVLTIDAIAYSGNLTSMKLYSSSNNSSWTEIGTFSKSTGAQAVTINTPTANLYYKIEVVCTKATGNGVVQISKVEYYHNAGGGNTPTITTDAANNSLAVPNQTLGSYDEAGYATLTVSGTNLTAGIALNLGNNSPFEMSTDLDNWLSTVTIPQSGGSVTDEEVVIRLKESLATPQAYSGNVTLSSTGAEIVTVALTGSVINPTYTLTDESGANGSINFSTSTAEAGAHVTLTPTPASGAYYFVPNSWSFFMDDLTDVTEDIEFVAGETNVIVMPAYNLHVDASFQLKPTYAITAVATPAAGGTVVTDDTAWEGKVVEIAVQANSGYALSSLTATYVNGGATTDLTITNNTFVMPAFAVTVTATFEESNDVTYDFTQIEGFSSWNNSYLERVVEYPTATVTFDAASRQTMTITDQPVTKGNPVTIVMAEGLTLTSAAFVCTQWSNKAQTITLHYSTDGGEHFTSTGVTSSNFRISANLPVGTNAVKLTFSSTSNQVGIASATVSIQGSAVQSYTLTLGNHQHINDYYVFVNNENSEAAEFDENDEMEVYEGATVYVSVAEVEDCYLFNGLSVTYGDNQHADTTKYDDMYYSFVMPAGDATLNFHTSEATQYTLTVAGSHFSIEDLLVGVESDIVTLENNQADICEKSSVLVDGLTIATGYVLTSVTLTYGGETVEITPVLGSLYEFQMPSSNATLTFTTAPAPTYTLANSIETGKSYIIVGFDGDDAYAMGEQKTSNRAGVAVTVNGTTAFGNENIHEVVITALEGDDAGTYTIEDNGYLYAASSSYNHLKTEANLDANGNGKWTIVIGSDGAATIIAQGTYTHNRMRFNPNNGSPLFSCYSGTTGSLPKLYVKVETPATETYTTETLTGYGNGDGHYYLIASPVYVNPTNTNMLTVDENDNPTYDLYYFDQGEDDEWRNYRQGEFDLVPGVGYLYANKNNIQLTFTGVPYDGDGEIELVNEEGALFEGWNLVGNPFGEAAVISDNYFEMNEDGDEIVAGESEVIAPMKGVFVRFADTEVEGIVTFEPATGTGTNLDDYKKVVLNLTRNRGNVIDRAIVRFGEGRQLPKFQLNENSTKVYFSQGNQDYAVVRSGNEGEMPVNFKAETRGSYTFTVETKNVEMNYLHLFDTKTGDDIDLLQTPSYTFEANVGDNVNRFRLMFDANAIEEHNAEASFAYFNGSEWVISNMGEATLQVVDVMGRVLSSETINGNAELSISEVPGVYMFRLVNGNNVKVQKVVVR